MLRKSFWKINNLKDIGAKNGKIPQAHNRSGSVGLELLAFEEGIQELDDGLPLCRGKRGQVSIFYRVCLGANEGVEAIED